MSLKVGGSTSKTSSTSNSNFNNTTTPIVPEWALSLTQNIAGRVGDLTHLDPQSLVAGVHPLQYDAAQQAAGLTGRPWLLNSAVGETGQVMNASAPQVGQAATASPYVQQYMDPYLHDVVGAADADLTAHEGQVRAQQDLDLAGSGAFGGSGAALTRSMTEGELARARATALSNLRSQGFGQALGAAQGDAQRAESAKELNAQLRSQQMDRALAAARQLTELSNSSDANDRANIATQAQVGDALRSVDQQRLSAPVTSTQQIVAMLSGLPIQLFTGEQKQGTESGSSTGKSSGMNWGAGADVSALFRGPLAGIKGFPL